MRKNRKGLAIVLMLIIVSSLVVIGLAFTISMTSQSEISKSTADTSDARTAARSAINATVAVVSQDQQTGGRFKARNQGNLQAAHVTGPSQVVTMDFLRPVIDIDEAAGVSAGFKAAFGKGVSGKTYVRDEQGKINLRTANALMASSAAAIARNVYDKREFTTIYSGRPFEFIYAPRYQGFVIPICQHTIPPPANNAIFVPMGLYGVLDNMITYFTGTKWQLWNGATPTIATPSDVMNALSTGYPINRPIGIEYTHPLNVNTADENALTCWLNGLSGCFKVSGQSEEDVTLDVGKARSIAREIKSAQGKWVSIIDFVTWLFAGSSATEQEKILVAMNALYPFPVICNITPGQPSPLALLGLQTLTLDHFLLTQATCAACFRTYADTYEITANTLVADDAGNVNSQSTARAVARINPLAVLTDGFEARWEFEESLILGNRVPLFFGRHGFPFGNKAVTMPEHIYPSGCSHSGLHSGPDICWEPTQGWVQMMPATDTRGRAQWLNTYQHFDGIGDQVEGMDLHAQAFPMVWNQVFYENMQVPGRGDIEAGDIEFWARLDQTTNSVLLFDVRESDYTDRLSLEYNQGMITLSLADETLETYLSQVRAPFVMLPEVWYHFGVFFKSTKFGNLAILVDGFAPPLQENIHMDMNNRKCITKLLGDLPFDPNDTTTNYQDQPIQLEDDSFTYDGMPLEIGREIVTYNKSTKRCARGARGTGAYTHLRGSVVQIHGYSCPLEQAQVNCQNVGAQAPNGYIVTTGHLPRGGATLADKMGAATNTLLAKDIDAAELTIPTASATFLANPSTAAAAAEISTFNANFPQKGYIRISDEVVKYDGLTQAPVDFTVNGSNITITLPAFRGTARGALGTTAVAHSRGENIRLFSIYVNSNVVFDSPCFVQVYNEWIGPVVRDSDPLFLTGVVDAGTPYGLSRGIAGSGAQDHVASEKVTQVFSVIDIDRQGRPVGGGDTVTITDMNMSRQMLAIGRQFPYQGRQLVAFTDFANIEYNPDQVYTRILKFPSGELMAKAFFERTNPTVKFAELTGRLDEIKCHAFPRYVPWRISGGISDKDVQVTVPPSQSMAQYGGVIKIGDEFIGYTETEIRTVTYTDAQGNTQTYQVMDIKGLKRGFLGSVASAHDTGDRLFNFAGLPITTLTSGISQTDSAFTFRQGMQMSQEGYLLIDSEVVGYRVVTGGNPQGIAMPLTAGGAGLYRGAFGTSAVPHSQNALVYAIPFRYWSTYKDSEWDDDMVQYYCHVPVPDGHIDTITVNYDISGMATLVEPVIFARLGKGADGADHWWDENPDGVSLRKVQAGPNKVDYHMSGEGQITFAVFFQYRPGAFYPSNDWKATPRLRQILVSYIRNNAILNYEAR